MNKWAHPAWIIIHSLALSSNDVIKEEWKIKMTEFSYIILCGYCSSNYKSFNAEYCNKHPDYLDNAFKYTVDLHNSVNEKNDKDTLSLSEAITQLSKFTETKKISEWILEFHSYMFNEFLPTVTFNSDEDKVNLLKKIEDFFIFIQTHISDEVFEFNKTIHAFI